MFKKILQNEIFRLEYRFCGGIIKMITDGGEDFDLFDDSKILQIDSPRENISGPFEVIYKDTDERWAIVTIKWDGKPCLGIRWFWDSNGMPNGHEYSTWFVVPDEIAFAILNGLPIKSTLKIKTQDFLAGKI